jgi:threonine/homoserine/homoserine lactone efflux protein
MTDATGLLVFLGAALLIAVTPGPGILYVAARSLSGGRAEGIASSLGTGLGGMVHIAAGAAGVSALVMASAEAFTLLKLAGAAYLVWLGLRTLREARRPLDLGADVAALGARRAFREGVVVEALNPKTAAFFLAFVPQFVDPAGAMPVALQFALLGLASVALNTGVDVLVALGAGRAQPGLGARPALVRRLRQLSGGAICALGALLAFARRPA